MSAPGLRLRVRSVALPALALLLFLAPAAPGQEAEPRGLSWRERFNIGMHVFRRTLFDLGFKPVNNFEQLRQDPRRSILIVLGDPDILAWLPDGGLKPFLEAGGAVLVATDYATEGAVGTQLQGTAGVRVQGDFLINRNKKLCYGEKEYRPYLIAPPENPSENRSSWLLRGAEGLKRVATDTPSRLVLSSRRLREGIEELAFLPAGCEEDLFPVVQGNRHVILGDLRHLPEPQRFREPLLFAVGGPVGKGRILVMADHSIFINALMVPTATDNVAFTYNALTWLRGENALTWLRGEDRQRTNVLLYIDGRVETRFEVPLRPRPSWQEIEAGVTAYVERQLDRVESRGSLGRVNQWLEDHLDLAWIGRALVLLLSVLLIVYLLYRFGVAAQYKLETGVPLLSRAVGQARPAAPLMHQRQQALLKQGNLWEEARGLARRLFAAALADPVLPPAMPRVEARGNWWGRRALYRRVASLWRLASGGRPEPMPPKRWRALLRQLDEVKAALADGTLSLHA